MRNLRFRIALRKEPEGRYTVTVPTLARVRHLRGDCRRGDSDGTGGCRGLHQEPAGKEGRGPDRRRAPGMQAHRRGPGV